MNGRPIRTGDNAAKRPWILGVLGIVAAVAVALGVSGCDQATSETIGAGGPESAG